MQPTRIKEDDRLEAGQFAVIYLNLPQWFDDLVQDATGQSSQFRVGAVARDDAVIAQQ